jgi:hypothetical protein
MFEIHKCWPRLFRRVVDFVFGIAHGFSLRLFWPDVDDEVKV